MNAKTEDGGPKPPEALNAGRFAERLWGYKGQVGSYAEMGRLYEKDRADFWQAKSNELMAKVKECDAWILWFSDIDREQVHFHGHGAKEAAIKAYEHAKMAWTCRLYHCVAHSGYGPETTHDSVTHETNVQRVELREIPSAWMRGIPPVSTPDAPGEWGVEFEYGDDQPEGKGWVPLYSKPQQIGPAQKANEPHSASPVADRQEAAPSNEGSVSSAGEAVPDGLVQARCPNCGYLCRVAIDDHTRPCMRCGVKLRFTLTVVKPNEPKLEPLGSQYDGGKSMGPGDK